MVTFRYDAVTCTWEAVPDKNQAAEIRKMLDPRNVLDTGCRVKKHPDCCILCALNEDCSRIPMHVRCRCTIEPYLSIEE